MHIKKIYNLFVINIRKIVDIYRRLNGVFVMGIRRMGFRMNFGAMIAKNRGFPIKHS
jgi:hypothetical protein